MLKALLMKYRQRKIERERNKRFAHIMAQSNAIMAGFKTNK